MKVKLGEWNVIAPSRSDHPSYTIDTPIGAIEVKFFYRGWNTTDGHWYCGLSCGSNHDGQANWILGDEFTGFENEDEAKAFIISEYEKLVLSLIEVE